jgi:tetratricopeptide (TPR) repeat protein
MPDEISLRDSEVAIAGRLLSMTRAEAVQRLLRAGGRHTREPGPSTAMLVAADGMGHLTADGAISRSLELFRELKNQGSGIRLVGETEFLRLLGAQDELADLSRLYTAAQVSRIAEVPLSEVRAWVRKGLLPPARQNNRLAWFEFKDIVQARTLSRLTSSGVPASQILRSLSDIATWLPDGERVIGRLEAYAQGLRVRLPDGSLADPTGQRLMDFQGDGNANGRALAARVARFPVEQKRAPVQGQVSASDWLAAAEEAEEQGDLGAAALGYGRALEIAPQAETYFNLGNVLYELGREADAAERYLQAIKAEHDFAEAWNNLGNALVTLKKLEDGVRAYEMALSLEPNYPDPHCNLATVLERLGRSEQAWSHRAACLRASPSEAHLSLLRQRGGDAAED